MSIFTGAGAAVANADTTRIGGDLNTSGALVKYDYTRTHTFNGPITIDIDDMPSTYLRLGLRNMKIAGGPQFGQSIQWNSVGRHSWTGVRKGTRFALQGRMGATWFWQRDNHWGGTITY
ncbi:hypothetical protein J2S49_001701 [Arcanobacterium wilhelmae]|uniref:Uncharacterized protein n=1 Tax=Arcanobacterium wilhelmae TaxID=1803177 RepID=A0ABT9ND29_9ACTO|nr:hypothetical protein [Arcanobacterium wilhelmae]MDP9801625.1 hypothetical protein [Arcanobacterium wilhelmae]WFN90947.1 hypothetical protein P8A24_03600 [Arcanobacterium wilhelmae]